MMDENDETYARVKALVDTFNAKKVAVTPETRFQQDLEWDSLTVLNFVAEVEDEFDVLIPVNMQAEIETVGQLAAALEKMKA
jgi:acyl carrier protein